MNKKSYVWKLFCIFFKIGLFTFGGGYAMIALLENEFVSNRKWIEKEEFLNMVVIAESTPGPIAINCATYIGYKLAGFAGALISTVAVSLPSVMIIYGISLFFEQFLAIDYVAKAFKGIQVCVVYLIACAGIRLAKGLKNAWFERVIFVSTVIIFVVCALFRISFSSLLFILISGMLGICVYILGKWKRENGK